MRVGRRGFTVLEAAVGLLIIGLSAIGVLTAFSAHSRATFAAQQTLEAVDVAEGVLMRLRFHEVVTGGPLPDSLRSGEVTLGAVRYTWRATRTSLSDLLGLAELSVSVDGPAQATLATYQAFRSMRRL